MSQFDTFAAEALIVELRNAVHAHEHVIPPIVSPYTLLAAGARALIEASAEIFRMRAAGQAHHDQRLDDRCHEDDVRLYEALGVNIVPGYSELPPESEFLESCRRYCQQRQRPCDKGLTPNQMTIAQLEAEVKKLRELLSEQSEHEVDGAATGLYAVDVYWADDEQIKHYAGTWCGVADSHTEARTKAVDEFHEPQLHACWSSVILLDPSSDDWDLDRRKCIRLGAHEYVPDPAHDPTSVYDPCRYCHTYDLPDDQLDVKPA